VKDPARVVPKAIIAATTFTYLAGLLFNIVLVFCMGDLQSLLNTPTGQPVRTNCSRMYHRTPQWGQWKINASRHR
jgi:hypothetical protein